MIGFPTQDERCLQTVKNVLIGRGLPLRIVKKEDSWFMRLIGFAIKPFNPRFMKGYATTIPFLGRIYVPGAWYETSWWRTLAHEGIHLEQARRDGQLKFALKYLFPQCLGLLSILAFGAFLWFPMIWCLIFLAFLAPWPAKYRTRYEREAYVVTGAMDKMRGLDIRSDLYTEYMLKHYLEWGYYKPVWRRESIEMAVRAEMLYAEHIVDMTDLSEPDDPLTWILVREVKAAMEPQ